MVLKGAPDHRNNDSSHETLQEAKINSTLALTISATRSQREDESLATLEVESRRLLSQSSLLSLEKEVQKGDQSC